jgi:putative ABC transport system permease protein
MGAQDISYLSLGLCFALLAIPLAIFIFFKIKIIKVTLWSALRMAVQLALVGIFLEYLFDWNNSLVNAAWLLTMITFAGFSVVGSSGLKYRTYVLPVFLAFVISSVSVLLYFNGVVLRLGNLLDARYLIAIAGMLLGNSLRGTIIGIGDFYKNVRRNENRYFYGLASGATMYEALAPYLRNGMMSALKPALANMATMGLVFLPGMMTGQILSGESPILAIKYQMAIVIAIFTCVVLTVSLTILFTVRISFDEYGVLKRDVFRASKAEAS